MAASLSTTSPRLLTVQEYQPSQNNSVQIYKTRTICYWGKLIESLLWRHWKYSTLTPAVATLLVSRNTGNLQSCIEVEQEICIVCVKIKYVAVLILIIEEETSKVLHLGHSFIWC
jgi:hypothetical protein